MENKGYNNNGLKLNISIEISTNEETGTMWLQAWTHDHPNCEKALITSFIIDNEIDGLQSLVEWRKSQRNEELIIHEEQ